MPRIQNIFLYCRRYVTLANEAKSGNIKSIDPRRKSSTPRIKMRVTILPYDESWAAAFLSIQAALSAALTTVRVLSIEHVGSTSVPGMAAKPVIDIDIVVAEEDIAPAIATLELNGYTYHKETASLDRYSFRYNKHMHLAKGTEELVTGEIRRNIYVCGPRSLSLRNHLAVREALRNDGELREEYSTVKMELAKKRSCFSFGICGWERCGSSKGLK